MLLPNFVPTPKWCESIEDNEWLSFLRHIRACEWSSLFQNETREETSDLPRKLKIPKFNRPHKDQIDEKIQVYCEMMQAKLRNLSSKVRTQYYRRHNLDPPLRKAFHEIKQHVNSNQIVICRPDKDGK